MPSGRRYGNDVGLAHLGQPARERVRDLDRHRHQLLGLARGVAEHHALVARALLVERVVVAGDVARLVGGVDALRDVGRLLVDRGQHRAGLGVEAVLGARVADVGDHAARELRDVDVGVGRDLAADTTSPVVTNVSQATRPLGSSLMIASSTAVGDLVGHLVRMALGDGLGREQELVV